MFFSQVGNQGVFIATNSLVSEGLGKKQRNCAKGEQLTGLEILDSKTYHSARNSFVCLCFCLAFLETVRCFLQF